MENASKALLIAGAILLVILIISLGILVYNQAKETTDQANLDTEVIQTFNSKITSYCGTNKSASDMNALMDAISASNGAQLGKVTSEQHYINVTVDSTVASAYYTGSASITGSNGGTYPSFESGQTYKATYTTGTDGYINLVTVSKQ